jgi:hypothetical protein
MKTNKIQKALARKDAIEAGAYDGRYKVKVIPNKKALANKKAARKKINKD